MPENQDSNSAEDTLTLDSDLGELVRLRKFVEVFCERTALPPQVRDHMDVVLEELTVNAVEHGHCEPRSGAIRIRLQMAGNRLQIAFCDNGVPFDPLAMPPPDLGQDLNRRPIGGLGIHLVRCLMPEIRYERRNNHNCLFLAKPMTPKSEPTGQQEESHANRHGDRAS